MPASSSSPLMQSRPPKAAAHPAGRHVDLAAAAATRSAANAMRAAKLASVAHDPQVWSELMQMQLAFLQQAGRIGSNWLSGLVDWSEQCAQIRSANTMGKLLEQDGNAINQLGALVTQNVTDFVTLVEGVQVGFGYWVEQKLAARDAAQPESAGPVALIAASVAPVAATLDAPPVKAEPAAAAPPAANASTPAAAPPAKAEPNPADEPPAKARLAPDATPTAKVERSPAAPPPAEAESTPPAAPPAKAAPEPPLAAPPPAQAKPAPAAPPPEKAKRASAASPPAKAKRATAAPPAKAAPEASPPATAESSAGAPALARAAREAAAKYKSRTKRARPNASPSAE